MSALKMIPLVLLLVTQWAAGQYVAPEAVQRRRELSRLSPRDDQSSTSRAIHISSFSDFCLFGPPDAFTYIWNSGLNVVAWCTKDGSGTRLIPDGTLHGVTYVKTDNYVQVSGSGDFTKINLAPGDPGGQFDSTQHTPAGAAVTIGDDNQNATSWVTMISADTYCFRACTGDPAFCPAQYDQVGCYFLTSNTVGWDGNWQDCEADDSTPPGVFDGTTYTAGSGPTPTPTTLSLSNCQQGASVSNGQSAPPPQSWTGATSSSTSTSSDSGSDGSNGNGNGNGNGGGGGATTSTSWVSVSTCAPCSGSPSPASSSASAGANSTAPASPATTTQVGITQVGSSTPDVEAAATAGDSVAGSASKSASSSSSTLPSSGSDTLNDKLDRRDDVVTTTSNGQCCWTTWTPTVVSATATSSSTSGSASDSNSAAGGASGDGAAASGTGGGGGDGDGDGQGNGNGSTTAAGSSVNPAALAGTSTRPLSGSARLSASGTGLPASTATGKNGTLSGSLAGNSTNSTGNATGAGTPRIVGVGVEGMGTVLLGTMGSVMGGFVVACWSFM